MIAWKVAALGFAAALGACVITGRASVESKKGAEYQRQLDRTVVFVQSGRLNIAMEESLKSRLVAALEARGVKAWVGDAGDKLGLEKPASVAEQAKAFQASTVLLLLPNGGTVNRFQRLTVQKYDGQLFDVPTQKMVWRASAHWALGSDVDVSADVMIGELLRALEADGLLRPRA